jgi:hypothetical protein
MRNLPAAIIRVLRQFELLFSERVWEWATILLAGTILASGKRTVTAALRVMGLSNERQFQNYQRVLNRAKLCLVSTTISSAGKALLDRLTDALAYAA